MDINGVNASEIYGAYQPQRLKAIVNKRIEESSAAQYQANEVEQYNRSVIAQTNSVDVESYNPKYNSPTGDIKGNLVDIYV